MKFFVISGIRKAKSRQKHSQRLRTLVNLDLIMPHVNILMTLNAWERKFKSTWKGFGNSCRLAAGNTARSCSNGRKGVPSSNVMDNSPKFLMSDM